MLKHYLLFVLLVITKCNLEAFELPQQFSIETPSLYMVGNDISYIRAEKQTLGFIERQVSGSVWSIRIPHYELYSAQSGFEAIAKVVPADRQYRAIFSVEDIDNHPFGRVEENWEGVYFAYNPTFEIYSAEGKLLAIGKGGSAVTLIDPIDQHVLVTFVSGGTFILGGWTVEIKDPDCLNYIDPRLLILTLSLSADKAFHYKLCKYQPSTSMDIFQRELEQYEDIFEGVEASEVDVNFIKSFTEPLLAEVQKKMDSQADFLERGFNVLIPLLDNQTLTIEQKKALLLMMKQRLEHIE